MAKSQVRSAPGCQLEAPVCAAPAEVRAPFSYKTKLQPYIKNDQIFRCPSAPAWPAPGPGRWFTTDYGNNHNESNLQGASKQAWYIANPDFGFNEMTQIAAIA